MDASYSWSLNTINVPAGILQSPFYDKNAVLAEKYGHLGFWIGHELTHGFDDVGRQYDEHGNLKDWWTTEDAQAFRERAACFVNEYEGFEPFKDIHINGKLTLGENIADNGGLRLAWFAFLAAAERSKTDLSRTEQGYASARRFFLAYAQNFCGDENPKRLRLELQTDPHSPRQFRVNGVVQNMMEFGDAFGCKAGQPMMRSHRCRVW